MPSPAPTRDRTVRIFLSSTFRDFGEERDLLVRHVFPALRARLKERMVELVDVDLRWGITARQAERGEVLPICLAEIDRARPYFIGMLGERYGWIPSAHGYASTLIERQPWLAQHRGGKSVTELEILHGVLNERRMRGRAFFYFRSKAYSVTKGGDYLPGDPADRRRQADLKRRIRASGYPVTGYRDPQALARRLERDLWTLLDAEFPADSVPDAFERTARRHDAYAAPRRRMYLGAERTLAALDATLAQPSARVLIEGASGGGKSALLANALDRHARGHPRDVLHAHYLGASADAADPHTLVRRLVESIRRRTGSPQPIPDDPVALYESLPTWLATAAGFARRRRIRWIIALDALNSLSDLRDLRWFPEHLPAGLHLWVSCLDGEVREALLTKGNWQRVRVRPLSAPDRKALLTGYLARYNKTLPTELRTRTLAHPLSGNPLFLKTLAEELRLFGVHEQLSERLHHYLASDSIDALFERVLARVESDCGSRAVRATMTALWASRSGLTEGEILGITGLVPATWAPIRNALDEALLESNGRITFAHDYLRAAVTRRYLPGSARQRAAHRLLAQWFAEQPADGRRAEEEPWQWRQAGDWSRLRSCLLRRDMFNAVLGTQGTQALLAYWIALETECGADTAAAHRAATRRWIGQRSEGSSPQSSSREDADAVLAVARFLVDAGRIGAPAHSLVREAIRRQDAARGPRHAQALSARNVLASLLSDAGRYEQALPIHEEVLTIRRRRLGVDHPDTQTTLGNLALLLTYMGRFSQAQTVFDELLPSLRRTRTKAASRLDYLTALNNQGLLHYYQDQFEPAQACFVESWRLLRAVLGPDHPDNGDKINNLANLYFKQGRLDEAIALHRQCLDLWQRGLGDDSARTASSCNNLGFIHLMREDHAQAEPMLDRARVVYLRRLGDRHPHTMSCENSLATLYSKTGRRQEAITLFKKVLAGRREILGDEHPQTRTTRSRLESLVNQTANGA